MKDPSTEHRNTQQESARFWQELRNGPSTPYPDLHAAADRAGWSGIRQKSGGFAQKSVESFPTCGKKDTTNLPQRGISI
jgi:hypothetical protein